MGLLKLALEVETRPKNSVQWKKFFQRYSVDLFERGGGSREIKPAAVNGVLVVGINDVLMENIGRRVFTRTLVNTFPQYFFLTSMHRLETGRGRNHKGIMELKDLGEYLGGLRKNG